jgi:hypothetical protein
MVLLAVILAMGIYLHWNLERVTISLPPPLAGILNQSKTSVPLPGYFLATYFPFYDGMRAWSRFLIVGVLGLGALAALGASVIQRRYRHGTSLIVLAIVGVLFEGLASYEISPFSSAARPVDTWLAGQPTPAPIIEYPWNGKLNKRTLLSQLFHHQPMVNGHADQLAAFLRENRPVWLEYPNDESVQVLRDWSVKYVLINRPTAFQLQEFDASVLAPMRSNQHICSVGVFRNDDTDPYPEVYVFQILKPGEECARAMHSSVYPPVLDPAFNKERRL